MQFLGHGHETFEIPQFHGLILVTS